MLKLAAGLTIAVLVMGVAAAAAPELRTAVQAKPAPGGESAP